MHETFLEEVLSDLAAQGYDITTCRYVLPSKRSAFFLKRHLQARVSQTIFAPDILAIEDFIGEITSLSLAPTIELLMELFSVYQNRLGKALQEDFHSFSKWGQTLLQDFNEIDRYLIPADDILNYLKAIKEIDHWSLQEQKTEMVENYCGFPKFNMLITLFPFCSFSLCWAEFCIKPFFSWSRPVISKGSSLLRSSFASETTGLLLPRLLV
ncbi:MAG: hypothetical protein AAFQ20_08840 [Bacteroidota bacterium]